MTLMKKLYLWHGLCCSGYVQLLEIQLPPTLQLSVQKTLNIHFFNKIKSFSILTWIASQTISIFIGINYYRLAKQRKFSNLNEVWQIKFADVITNYNIWVHFTQEVLQLKDKAKLKLQTDIFNKITVIIRRKREKKRPNYKYKLTSYLLILKYFYLFLLKCLQADEDPIS